MPSYKATLESEPPALYVPPVQTAGRTVLVTVPWG